MLQIGVRRVLQKGIVVNRNLVIMVRFANVNRSMTTNNISSVLCNDYMCNMKRKSTLVDSVSAEPEVSAVGRNQQFPQSNSANSTVGKKLSIVNCALSIVNYPLSIVNCTLLIVFCLFFGGKAWGQQTLLVHNGSATNDYVPVYGFYADAYLKCEFVYPASELSDMAGGTISSMTFYLSSPAAEAWTGTFDVYMEEIANATISNFSITGSATNVYTGTLNATGSTMNVEFDNDYIYNGGNLLVGFYLSTTGNYKSATFSGETVSGASVQGYSYSSLSAITATQRDFLPKTTFTYTPPSISVCQAPTSLTYTDVTDNSVTLRWIDYGTATQWWIFWDTQEYAAANPSWRHNTGFISPVDKTYTITGLNPGTNYRFRIFSVCGEGDYRTCSCPDLDATTDCTPSNKCEISIELTDAYSDGGGSIQVINSSTSDVLGSYTLSSGASETYTLSVCNGTPLSFVYASTDSWSYENGFVITDPNGDVIVEHEGCSSSGSCSAPTNGEVATYTVNCGSCPKPTSLTASDITNSGATINWSSAAESFEMEYVIAGELYNFDDNSLQGWTNLKVNSDGGEWIISDNNRGGYDYSDRSHSGTSFAMSYSYVDYEGAFNTNVYLVSPQSYQISAGASLNFWYKFGNYDYPDNMEVCVATAANPTVSDFTSIWSSSTVSDWEEVNINLNAYNGQTIWIAFHHEDEDQYEIWIDDVTINAGNVWVPVSGPITTTQHILTGLESETTYSVHVRADCGDDESAWSDIVTFTTLPCPVPTSIAATPSNRSAAVSWTGTEDSYNVRYREIYLEEGFESGIPSTWTTIDNDGDGYTWLALSEVPTVFTSYTDLSSWARNGSDAATSASYANGVGSLNSDNWLISPQFLLGGTLQFYVSSKNSDTDSYEVLLSTTGTNPSDFSITLKAMKPAVYDIWTKVSIDLSSYAGQHGYIAIHHVSEDKYFLVVDDFGLYGPWQSTTASTNSITLNNLTAETQYEVQVQTDCGSHGSIWESTTFTTLPEYTVSASVNPSGVGTISGDGIYAEDATCTLTATLEDDCYTFVNWTENGTQVSTSATYSFDVTEDRNLVANFNVKTYAIGVSANPSAGGTVDGGNTYNCGATATLEATANTGYHFVNWTKNSIEVSTSDTYSFTVTEAADYVANFEINTYTVTTVIHPTEGGSAEGAGTYTHGSSCTLAATANSGYQFVNWTAADGSVVSANASYTFTVTGDVTYQANFTKTTVTSLPWTENFEGYSCGTWEYLHGEWATPLRWTKAACVTNYSWGAYSDSYCMELRANNSTNLVVLPQFDGPLNKLKIKFQIGRGNTASGYTVKLGYVTDPSDASTFHELSTINTPSNPVASHTQYTCDLTTNNNAPSSSEYRLAIKYTTTNMEDSWYLDDFDVRRVYTIAVSDEPSSSASSLTGAGKYDHGATCTVTATAGDCYNFVNWTENGTEVSTSASYSFTAEADRNLVANFTQWTLNIDNNQTSLECINTGTEVVLTASATSNSTPTYEWAVSSGSTEGTASSNTYTVSPTALSNTYKVSATVGGCVVSASNTVTVKPNITNISSSEGDEVCFGLTTELAATCTDANASYSWNGGAGSGSPWTTPAITGTTNFTVVATGTNSCTVESTKSIGMKVPGNQPMTHAPEHGAIWTGYESADWSDVDNWVYFDGSYRALEGLSDTLNLILRTGDSDKCILNNPVINSPSFASNSGMIVRRPITIGEGTELNIDGDLNVESGSITFSSTGALLVTGNANIASGASVAFDNKDTLSIAGNLVLEGSLDFPESDTTPALRLGGNLVIDGGSLDEGGTLVFAGSGTQNVSNGASPLTLNNNVRLNMHRSRAGVPHTIFPDGTIFSKTTIFEYGIMDGDVTFNATGRTIVCGDYESYASGRITKIGAGNNFTFPTGDDNVLGSITAKINSGNTVHAKFHHNSADNGDGTHGFGLDVIPRWWNVADMCSDDPEPFNHVSNFEYWDISSPVELSNVILMANSATAAEHFHNPSEYTESDIQVAAFNNGCWGNFGGTAEISGSDHNVITITGAKIPKDPHRVVADFLITLGSKSHETLLPIELTSFTATCDGRSTLIEWTTATERNNDYFSLERSDDAINFTEVARVAGAGNSIEPIDYAYNDYGIHGGDNYYRLVQVDYDGTRTVSEVIVANCIEPESDGEPEVLAYPNPFSSELTVVLDNFGNRAATIEVYDMLGKLIYTNKVAAPQNSYETILNLSNLPPAAYTVRVSTNDFVINRNVVKQ